MPVMKELSGTTPVTGLLLFALYCCSAGLHAGQPAAGDTVVAQTSPAIKQKVSTAPKIDPDWRPPVAPKIELPPPVSAAEAQRLARDWGVELISMQLTSANMMMDFRFRVLDVEKALPLFDHRIKPFVIAERSNIKLPVPMAEKVGALRPTNRGKNIKAGKNYYMIFGNPDRHVQRGEQVTLEIGDFRVEHLTVN